MRAAIFDVDNTLLRGSSLFAAARGSIAAGDLPAGLLARAAAHHVVYRSLARETGIDELQGRSLRAVEGRDATGIQDAACRALAGRLPALIYPGAAAMLRDHLAEGDRVYLASASPLPLVRVVAAFLGAHVALGTLVGVEDGRFTGRLDAPLMRGPAKADAVARALAKDGLDMSQASAYSDSYHDLPLLTMVGHAHAVNPDARLRKHARSMNWPVHDLSRRHATATAAMAFGAGSIALAGIAWLVKTRRAAT